MEKRLVKGQVFDTCLAEYRVSILCQFVQVVQKVYVKELGCKLFWEAWLDSEMKLSVTQFENTMPFVVVDQSDVVQLGGAQTNRVV